MNGKVQRAIFGGVVATALVGGIGFSLATVLPASARVMGPATRMAMPGGQFQRGLDGVGLQGRQAQGPDAMAFGRGRDAVARPDIDGVLATTLGITEEQAKANKAYAAYTATVGVLIGLKGSKGLRARWRGTAATQGRQQQRDERQRFGKAQREHHRRGPGLMHAHEFDELLGKGFDELRAEVDRREAELLKRFEIG